MPKGEILAIAIYWQKFKKFSVIKSGQDKWKKYYVIIVSHTFDFSNGSVSKFDRWCFLFANG
jgi:hypothetical protein